MMKHPYATPGPWRVVMTGSTTYRDGVSSGGFKIVAPGDGHIESIRVASLGWCTAHDAVGPNGAIRADNAAITASNAYLLASSPALYAALRRLLIHVEADIDRRHDTDAPECDDPIARDPTPIERAVDEARSALALADGHVPLRDSFPHTRQQ